MLEQKLEQELQAAAEKAAAENKKQIVVNELIAAFPNMNVIDLANVHAIAMNPIFPMIYREQIASALVEFATKNDLVHEINAMIKGMGGRGFYV